jgi:hypothetical protein
VFDSVAYVHIPKEKRKKLDEKAEKCILVGYSDEQKGYKCYNPRTKQACVSRDVVFDESSSWYLSSVPEPDSNPSSDGEVSEAEVPPDVPEIGTQPESPISVPLIGPSACKNVRCGSSRETTADVFRSRERDSRKRERTQNDGRQMYKQLTVTICEPCSLLYKSYDRTDRSTPTPTTGS